MAKKKKNEDPDASVDVDAAEEKKARKERKKREKAAAEEAALANDSPAPKKEKKSKKKAAAAADDDEEGELMNKLADMREGRGKAEQPKLDLSANQGSSQGAWSDDPMEQMIARLVEEKLRRSLQDRDQQIADLHSQLADLQSYLGGGRLPALSKSGSVGNLGGRPGGPNSAPESLSPKLPGIGTRESRIDTQFDENLPRVAGLYNRLDRKGRFQPQDPKDSTHDRGGTRYPECRSVVFPPTMWETPPDNSHEEAPAEGLTLEWIYGYRGNYTLSPNVFYTKSGEILYYASATAILYNSETHTQRFFHGHDDDICSCALHPRGVIVATGQVGQKPPVFVWDSDSMECYATLNLHMAAVPCMAFNMAGDVLLTVGMDNYHTIGCWNWREGQLLATTRGHNAPVNNITFDHFRTDEGAVTHYLKDAQNNPIEGLSVATSGKDHIKFWHLDGAWTFRGKTGTFGKGGTEDILCQKFIKSGTIVTGTPSGNILVWNAETTLVTNVLEAHQGPVYALDFETDAQVVCSSGKDGMIRLWDVSNKKKKKGPSFSLLRTIDINVIQTDDVDIQQAEHDDDGNVIVSSKFVPHCRSMDWQGHSIAIGTNTNSIGEVQLKQESDNAACTTFTQAHVGRCDALSMHPSKPYFCTGAEDRTLRIWDMKARKVLNVFQLPHQARCVDWSTDAQFIACGLNSGEVAICSISPDMKTIKLLAKKNTAPPPPKDKKKKKGALAPPPEDARKQKLWKVAEEVQDLKFSPDGSYLACGSRDNYIHVYDCTKNYHRCAILRGHSSYITHLDWTADGKFIQSTDGAYEILYWEAGSWKQFLRPTELSDTSYQTWTCVLGWPVMGIWPDYSDGTDVGACDASKSRKLLVTADDFSLVKLMKFPCISKDCETKDYRGHSSHVMNCRFSCDDKYVVSVGGLDQSIFQWKVSMD